MNYATFERAQVAAFAYKEAQWTGSLDCMRAICFVLRNRVRAGWGNGTWLSVINAASHCAGYVGEMAPDGENDRLLQMIIRDIDDIYLGSDRMDDSVRDIVVTDDRKKPALYYSFINHPIRDWFKENIIRNSQEHAHIGNIGPMMLFR